MKQALTMPALSDTMNNGRLARWLKQPGQPVKSGEAIAEVETDKAIMEVEAFHDGYLAGPLAPVDQELPIGATIGYIADSAAEAGSSASAAPAKSVEKPAPKAAAKEAAKEKPAPQVKKPAAAPAPSPVLAAAEAGAAHGWHAQHPHADLPDVQGRPNGQDTSGAITTALSSAASAAPDFLADGPPYKIARASSLREAVARTMIAAAATPTFRVSATLPLAPLQAQAHEKKLSLTLLLARACARAIMQHPLLNKAFTDQGLAERERIDIGIAVDSPDGLITPILRDAGARSLADLAADWDALKERVKTRRLAASDYRGATFYISDLGVFPVVTAFDSIVPLGASAILSIAANRPEGALCTLSCDHRVIFGADAARFLATLAEILAEPAKLFDEATKS